MKYKVGQIWKIKYGCKFVHNSCYGKPFRITDCSDSMITWDYLNSRMFGYIEVYNADLYFEELTDEEKVEFL